MSKTDKKIGKYVFSKEDCSKGGKLSDWSGRKHKEESKKKIGEGNKISQMGKKNSQYGSIWINNGELVKKVNKDSPLPKGWYRGRKLITEEDKKKLKGVK